MYTIGIGGCVAAVSLLANYLEAGFVRGVLFAVVVCIAAGVGAARAVRQ
jgi:hypothetical protein